MAEGNGGGNGVVSVVGIIAILILVGAFLYFGIPMLRGNQGGTNINVPDKINVTMPQSN